MNAPDSLNSLLGRWRHDPAPAPDFAAGVWARIGANRQDERVVVAFRWALPLAASLALIAGVGLAHQQVQREHAERMADSYVRTVDPILIVAEAAPAPR
jgi:hypothetical protein